MLMAYPEPTRRSWEPSWERGDIKRIYHEGGRAPAKPEHVSLASRPAPSSSSARASVVSREPERQAEGQ